MGRNLYILAGTLLFFSLALAILNATTIISLLKFVKV